MIKTYQYKLYSNRKNKYLHNIIDTSAHIYNHCIALHRRYYRIYKKYLNKFQLQKHLTKIKRLHPDWSAVGSQAIQDITDRIDRAYQAFFSWLKKRKGPRFAPPSFKKTFKYKSLTLKQAGFKLLGGNRIRIGKQIYKFFNSREINGKIKTLTIKRDKLGDIYLFAALEVENESGAQAKIKRTSGKNVAFDFGLKTLLTDQNGNEIESPQFFKQHIKDVKKANRSLKRKQKRSNNRKKTRIHLARVHKRIANKRKDFHFKLANELVSKYDYIFLETLNMSEMKKRYGRKISDLGFYSFLRILENQANKFGSNVIYIDRWFPSSKMCSSCFRINNGLSLKDRDWVCESCGSHHNRDHNAAKNIYRVGTSTLKIDNSVRPSLKAGIDNLRIQ